MTSSPNPPATALLWPSDRDARCAELAAVRATRDGWRRAYNREPATPAEAALGLLTPLLADLFDRDPELGVTTRHSLAAWS